MNRVGAPNWPAIAGVIAIVAIGGFAIMAPKPKLDPRLDRPIEQLEEEKAGLREQNDQAASEIESMTWQTSRDEISPRAMAWVSRAAQANYVTVSAFRPQRTVEAEGLDQLNYLVTAEGAFLNVMGLIDAFESEGSLLAVKTVQLASVDGSTDTVRVTLGLVAYQGEVESGS